MANRGLSRKAARAVTDWPNRNGGTCSPPIDASDTICWPQGKPALRDGSYRERVGVRHPTPRELADALGTTVERMSEAWFRLSVAERPTIVDMYGLPSLSPRTDNDANPRR